MKLFPCICYSILYFVFSIRLQAQMLVAPMGTSYCSDGEGVTLRIDKSEKGTLYQLQKSSGTWITVSTLTGSGGNINFPGNWPAGKFRLINATKVFNTLTVASTPSPGVTFTSTEKSPPDCGTVDFDATPTGNGPFTYHWDFGTGTSTHEDPIYQFNAYGTGTQQFPVSLQVTDKIGCVGSFSQSVSVNQRPDATVDKKTFWNNCNSATDASFLLSIVNKSTTAGSNTSYTIDWDDPMQPDVETYTSAQFPFDSVLSHTYTSKGSFQLSVTASISGSTGCTDTKIFPVFNGSTPSGGITYEQGILNGCAPHTITFKLSGAAKDNAPSTQYYFDFGDGSEPTVFYQENMPVPDNDGTFHVIHTFEKESCSYPGMSFMLQHYIINSCPPAVYQPLGGITISKQPAADFLRAEFPTDPIFVCAGIPRIFTNESSSGCLIANGEPITVNGYHWDFNNDGIYESTDESPSLTFATPGEYEVTLQAITGESITPNCGGNESTRRVCAQAAPVAKFTIPPGFITGTPFTPENKCKFDPDFSMPEYLWTVTPNVGFSYVNNTDSSSFEPEFNFTVSGDYIIRLDVTVNSGNSACNTATYEQSISTILGLSDNSGTLFKIFPNPANDAFTISIPGTSGLKKKITIRSCSGTVAMKIEFADTETSKKFSVGNLTKGLYVVELEMSDKISRSKLIVQ